MVFIESIKNISPLYKGPIEYFNLEKFSAFILGKEIGYTSFIVKDDLLYIELISVSSKYRGYGIAYITFMLSIHFSRKNKIHTNGLSKTGRLFMEKLGDRGILVILDDCNLEITPMGMRTAKDIYNNYLIEQ